MKNIFDPADEREILKRLDHLRPESPRQWGTMTPAQMLAHCSISLEMAMGNVRPPRKWIGRLLGPVIRPMALKDDAPMRRNSPTMDELIVAEAPAFEPERERLRGLIDRFVAAGPAACTTHPHSFFGRLTPDQWSILTYKHLDHHLRQFGV
jgi:hypothetical protein